MKKILLISLFVFTLQANAQRTSKGEVKELEKMSSSMNSSEDQYNQFKTQKTKSAKHRYGDTFKCESYNGQRQHCYADTSGGIRLKRQLSYNNCRGNWGYDYYGVWVTKGCRAEFTTDRYQNHWGNNYRQDDIVRCESYGMRRNNCSVGQLRNAQVTLIHQLSRYSCQGNWGHNNKEIWVARGCKADFRISRYDNDYDHGGNELDLQTIQCESRGNYMEYCEVPELEHVEIVDVLSRRGDSCRGNWGYDPRGIWVKNGCKAQFGFLEYQRENYDEHYDDGAYQSRYFDVKCKSRSNQMKICNAKNFERVELKREISKGKYPCKGNWGINRFGELYVKNNCYAEFRVWK